MVSKYSGETMLAESSTAPVPASGVSPSMIVVVVPKRCAGSRPA